ncbi:hypothetical protein GmHk_20G057004 [Glycine max]|nr:hypothetical protein GmHk_20G057004 [Glycine max]
MLSFHDLGQKRALKVEALYGALMENEGGRKATHKSGENLTSEKLKSCLGLRAVSLVPVSRVSLRPLGPIFESKQYIYQNAQNKTPSVVQRRSQGRRTRRFLSLYLIKQVRSLGAGAATGGGTSNCLPDLKVKALTFLGFCTVEEGPQLLVVFVVVVATILEEEHMACLDQQHSGKEGQAVVVVEDLPISDLDDSSNLDCIFCLKGSKGCKSPGLPLVMHYMQSTAGDLIPIDLETNATCRRRNSKRIINVLQELEAATTPEEEPRSSEASSSFPIAGHSHIEPVEDPTMAEEPRRVTLEDYSSSTVPQFFTSIAQPEVGGCACRCKQVESVLISLSGEAKRWLHSFKGNNLKSWDEVVEKFLKKHFPESKTAEGKAAISSFHQFPDESLSEALERFRGLLRKTLTHGFLEPIQLNIFIDGLRPQSKQIMDALARGKIKMKAPDEAMDLIESMVASDIAILRDRAHIPTKKSLLELTSQDALLAQNKLLSKQLETLTKTLSKLPTQLHSAQTSHSFILQVAGCTICGGAHESGCCIPNEEKFAHEVNYMGNQPRGNFNTSGCLGFQNNQHLRT